jgi:cytochrome c oxidase subunit 4
MAIATHEETDHGTGHAHPSDLQYVYVALVLAFITGAEVFLGYQDVAGVILWVMLAMMVMKFAIVALWFMHLRFDSILFRRFFVTGLVLAVLVYVGIMMTAFQFFGDDTTSLPLDEIPPPASVTN